MDRSAEDVRNTAYINPINLLASKVVRDVNYPAI